MTAIGFISEHTAEYILVPRLVSLLSPHFVRIVPFYFWSTREGNSMSRECGPRESVRLLSIFARRPKVASTRDNRIVMKLNTDLFRVANIASAGGIPVFAGVPLVTSIAELTLDAPCQWFHLAPDLHDVPDMEVTMQSNGALVGAALPDCVTGPLDADAFVRIIHQAAQSMTWDEGIENLRYIRSNSSVQLGHARYRLFGGYRPFHLMFFDS